MTYQFLPANCRHASVEIIKRERVVVFKQCRDCGAILFWKYSPLTELIRLRPYAPAEKSQAATP